MTSRRLWSITLVMAALVPSMITVPLPAAELDAAEDEALMKPTRAGLRLTPALARGLAKYYVRDEVDSVISLQPGQKSRLSEAIARRMMRLAHENGPTIQAAGEHGLGLILEADNRFNPETGQAFAKHARPMLPVVREFLAGVADEAHSILTPEQFDQIQAKLNRESKELDRFDNKMKRWADGGAKKRENLDDFEPEDGPKPEREPDDPSHGRLQQAERWARWRLKRFGPPEWKRYVVGAKYFFKFDDEQSAEADQLLESATAEARAIMTPEWKNRWIRNRILDGFHHHLDNVPTAPWRFHLNRERDKLTEPIEELGRKLREEVFALVASEQREAAMARLRTMAERHGMIVEESDTRVLGLETKK